MTGRLTIGERTFFKEGESAAVDLDKNAKIKNKFAWKWFECNESIGIYSQIVKESFL